MIATRDIWNSLTKDQKREKIAEALTQIDAIDNNTHALSDRFDQGRLSGVKKDLEQFVINALTWESDRQLQKHY